MNTRRRRPTVGGVTAFVGRFVEARTGGGACWRGRLLGVNEGLLEIERACGRTVLVPVSALVALVDEERLTPREPVATDEAEP